MNLQVAFTTANGTSLFHNEFCFCVIEENHISEIINAIRKDIASSNIENKTNAISLLAKIEQEGITILTWQTS